MPCPEQIHPEMQSCGQRIFTLFKGQNDQLSPRRISTNLCVAGGVLIPDPNIKKEYDLVYSNQGGQWNDFARNWTLAKSSIITLVQELNFKVLSFAQIIIICCLMPSAP